MYNGARQLVISEEWEQRLGGLRLARLLLQREVRHPPANRWLVEVPRWLALQVCMRSWLPCCCIVQASGCMLPLFSWAPFRRTHCLPTT